jgi:hypothetical protein
LCAIKAAGATKACTDQPYKEEVNNHVQNALVQFAPTNNGNMRDFLLPGQIYK